MHVLFLPGLDGEARSVQTLQRHLTRVELVAFGYPTGRDLEWNELADLVAAKLKSLGTGLVAGESFGGAVALKTALLRKDAVSSICLLGSFNHEPEPFAASLGRTASRLLPKTVLSPVARLLADWKIAGNLRGEERQKFLNFFEKLDYTELARRLKLLKHFDVSDNLVGIKCPVEIIYGSEDSIAGDRRQLDMWERLPNKRLHRLDGVGHIVCREVPIGVARRIDEWAEAVS